jgi:hypothetical protein
MTEWVKRTTCSRTSSGICKQCRGETYFAAYIRESSKQSNGIDFHVREILCEKCYETNYEPTRAAERQASIQKADEDRQRDLELALKGELPGAIVYPNGTVLGPEKRIFGLPYRQVLQQGLIDISELKHVPPMDQNLSWNFFKKYPQS